MSKSKKILLDESEIPLNFYNIQADMPNPMLPPLHPVTKKTNWSARSRNIVSNGIDQAGSIAGKIYRDPG